MLQTVSPLALKLSLFLVTAVATHLVMSFGQTLIHYKVAHNPMSGKIYRNHLGFHHTHYSDDHLVSGTHLGDEGNTTPYFFIPVLLVGGCAYWAAPGSADTELGVLMEPEVSHGEAEVYTRVQA
jgi:hypothetical protein